MTKKKQPLYEPPAAHSYVRCHRCNETVISRSGVLMGVDDHGAWERHRHQPQGYEVRDRFDKELAAARLKKIGGDDFRS